MTSIKHLSFENKIEFMRCLWNEAQPTYFHKELNFDVKLDENVLELSVFHYVDNLCGKLVRIDLSVSPIDPTEYNKMYGPNKFQEILSKFYKDNPDARSIQSKENIQLSFENNESCKCTRYYGNYSHVVLKDDIKVIVSLCNRCNYPYNV